MRAESGEKPNSSELAAWRAFLRAHATVTRNLEAELLAGQQLSLAAYDVLVQLVEAEGHRLRMTEMADLVLLSRSGVTRLVDRMERDGLVARERAAIDGRGVVAMLTPAGYERLRTASRTHLRGVKAHFVDMLSAAELHDLGESARKIADAQPPPQDNALDD